MNDKLRAIGRRLGIDDAGLRELIERGVLTEAGEWVLDDRVGAPDYESDDPPDGQSANRS